MNVLPLIVLALAGSSPSQTPASPHPWSEARPGGPPVRFHWSDLSHAQRAALRQAWGESVAGETIGAAPPASAPAAPEAPGALSDWVVITKDDDVASLPVLPYEGRLSPRAGPAGTSDFAAFRFSTGEIARVLPVTVPKLIVGFDNLLGRTTWPLIGLARESHATLLPDLATLTTVTGFAAPAGLPSGPPAVFQRFDVPLGGAGGVAIAADYFDDGGLSDDFDRTDEAFGTPPWLECTLSSCPGSGRLQLVGNRVVKQTAGSAVGMRTSRAAAVDALRPFLFDRDLSIRVGYDVSNNLAQSAGLAFRAEVVLAGPPTGPLDYYYLAEYKKGPPAAINLWAVVGGTGQLLRSAAAAAANAGTLEVRVEGVSPTRVRVYHNGGAVPVIDFPDTTYNFGGWKVGLASYDPGATSLNEAWDDFVVERNSDVFAVVQYPPGEDAALPGERSPDAFPHRSVLLSTDGTTFAPATAEPYCLEPPNGFVQVQAEDRTSVAPPDDADNVFRVEYKLDKLALVCPTCLTRLNQCPANPSAADATNPVLEQGQPVDLQAYWWNEHAADIDPIRIDAEVYQGVCFDSPLVASGSLTAMSPSPASAGGARHLTTAAPVLRWTPAAAGLHCIAVFELYDLNRDGAPDGFEPFGWPTQAANPDQNFLTQGILQMVEVFPPCTPLTVSNLAANSLRLTEDAVTAGQTWIEWSLADTGQFPAQYNVQLTEVKDELQSARALPIWREIVGRVRETVALPAPGAGGSSGIVHVVVFQNDGCESQRSLDP